MLASAIRDARLGVRLLLKTPGFTAVAVLTLALGIGATTAIFSVIYSTFFEPLPYRDPDRLVMVWSQFKGQRNMVGPLHLVEWKRQARVFDMLEAWGGRNMDFAQPGGPPELIDVGVTTPGWLPMFGYGQPLALGRNFLEHEGTAGHDQVVIVSHRFWRERLGSDPGIIGRDIRLNRKPYTVVGVLRAGPADENHRIWTPLAFEGYRPVRDYDWGLLVLGRMKPGVTLQQANAHMDAVSHAIERLSPDARDWRASVEPFRNNFIPETTLRGLWLLLGAVGFLLLIACANVANLLLARGTARRRELAVRSALGASGGRIVRQLLAESVFLAFVGGALGVGVAAGLLRLVLALMPPTMLPTEVEIGLNVPVLLFALAACTLSGVLAGAAPAFQAARANVNDALKEGVRTAGTGGAHLRHSLVVVEFALALMLLAGGGLAAYSLYSLVHRDLGFRPDRLLTFQVAMSAPQERFTSIEQMTNLQRELLERVQMLPGVVSAAMSAGIPIQSPGGIEFEVAGRPAVDPSRRESVGFNLVTAEYFRTLDVRIAHGRAFDDRDRAGSLSVAIVNEAFVRRYLGGLEPLEERVIVLGREWQIVGVHEDIQSWGPHRDRYPSIVLPFWQSPGPAARVLVRTAGEPTALHQSIAALVQSVDPDLPLNDVKTMEQIVAESMVTDRFNAVLFGGFALGGLLLAAFGIYGVMSFVVAQRTQEIGIRMALGAGRARILRHVVRQGMGTAIAGTIIGSAGALAVFRLMRGVLWGVSAAPPLAFVAVALVLLGAALVACLVPASRAASVDPIVALRQE